MFRKALTAAAILLAAFHAWLFVGQLWDGQLANLAVLGRWAVAGALAWAWLGLRRQGAPLLWGRKAIAIWSLAALLHGPAILQRAGEIDSPALPEIVATLAQATLGATVLIFAALAGFLLHRRRRAPRIMVLRRSESAFIGAISPDRYFRFSPRPPPRAVLSSQF